MRNITTFLFILCAMTIADANLDDHETNRNRQNARIAPCPESPNCVSSVDQSPKHRIEPLRYDSAEDDAFARLRGIIEAMPRTKIVKFTPNYLRAEFRSSIFGFVDDVELIVGEVPGVVHVRSASRAGYWDLGVNRRRVEQIREKFAQAARK